MSAESWRPIVGWEGIYEVSDQGRVRSLARRDRFQRRVPARILRPDTYRGGYLRVGLARDGLVVRRSVHHLVLEAFVAPRPDGQEGCHRNGDPADNRVLNLRWGTPSSNALDKVAHGTHNNARKTHCPLNHPLIEPNLVASQARAGKRKCLACHRAHSFALGRGVPLTQSLADSYFDRIGVAA